MAIKPLWILTLFVLIAQVQADIGTVQIAFHYRLQKCLGVVHSLQHSLYHHFSCLKSPLYRCLLFHEPQRPQYIEMRIFCGVVSTGHQLRPQTWNIAVPSVFSLYVDFHHFYFPSSTRCTASPHLILEAAKSTQLAYCGHRMPWTVSFPQSHVTVTCRNCGDDVANGYHFVLTFEAFDSQVNSVGLTQWNAHVTQPRDRYHNADSFVKYIFAYLARGTQYSFPDTEVAYSFISW